MMDLSSKFTEFLFQSLDIPQGKKPNKTKLFRVPRNCSGELLKTASSPALNSCEWNQRANHHHLSVVKVFEFCFSCFWSNLSIPLLYKMLMADLCLHTSHGKLMCWGTPNHFTSTILLTGTHLDTTSRCIWALPAVLLEGDSVLSVRTGFQTCRELQTVIEALVAVWTCIGRSIVTLPNCWMVCLDDSGWWH